MRILTGMLSTRDSGSTPTPPASNDHVLILRCLAVLPTGMWAESLSENEMGTIMEGLNHADATIRRLVSCLSRNDPAKLTLPQTLRLLDRLSPDLPRASYTNHLQAIRSSTDLALPLGYSNDNPAAKLRAAQEETALRALEAAEVILGLDEDTLKAGEVFGQSVGEVFEVLSEAQDRERRRIIWEQGVRVVLEILDNGQFLLYFCRLAADIRQLSGNRKRRWGGSWLGNVHPPPPCASSKQRSYRSTASCHPRRHSMLCLS